VVTDEHCAKAADRVMSELNACHSCGLSFGELTPASFSFNNPLGMCQECNGWAPARRWTGPDRPRSDAEHPRGAIEPWATGMNRGEGWTANFVEELSRAFEIDLDAPYGKLSRREKDLLMHAPAGGSSPSAAGGWSGRGW